MLTRIPNKRRQGEFQESRALAYLRKRGFQLITRNFNCKPGEIDLIGHMPPNHLVFVEVRFRTSSNYGSALSSVTLTKQARLRRAAAVYLQQHKEYQAHCCRFDVVAIQSCANGKDEIVWVKNAFC